MKRLLICMLWTAAIASAQYTGATSGSSVLNGEINGKVNHQEGAGAPSGVNCTVGKDTYTDTTAHDIYICITTGTPGTWARVARADVAQTFTGVQTMTSPAITTPAITGVATGSGVSATAAINTLALRNAVGTGEVIAQNTVATGKTAMATDTTVAMSQLPGYFTGTGTAQAQVVTTGQVTSLTAGLNFCFLPAAANTGAAPTLAVDGLTATAITKLGNNALVANDLATTTRACVYYDGTQFQLDNPRTYPTATNVGLGNVTNNTQLPIAGGTLTGNLLFTDNTLDIGATAATRPRTLFLGTSMKVQATTNQEVFGASTNLTTVTWPASSGAVTVTGPNVTSGLVYAVSQPSAGWAKFAGSTYAETSSLITLPYGCAVGDPAGSALATGVLCYIVVPMAGTITGWDIVTDAGTATVDVWKIATGTAKPTVTNTVTASAKPAIASGTAVHSTTLTSWTTSVSANDIIGFNLDAVATAKYITVNLQIAH